MGCFPYRHSIWSIFIRCFNRIVVRLVIMFFVASAHAYSETLVVSRVENIPDQLMGSAIAKAALAKIDSRSIEPNNTNTPKIPRAKPKSPIRLTIKAFIAAALADGFLYQKPINR